MPSYQAMSTSLGRYHITVSIISTTFHLRQHRLNIPALFVLFPNFGLTADVNVRTDS
jgi:hypothetical protein